jgi:hypothetical protein
MKLLFCSFQVKFSWTKHTNGMIEYETKSNSLKFPLLHIVITFCLSKGGFLHTVDISDRFLPLLFLHFVLIVLPWRCPSDHLANSLTHAHIPCLSSIFSIAPGSEVLGSNQPLCIKKKRERLPRNSLPQIPKCMGAFSTVYAPFARFNVDLVQSMPYA